MAVEDGGGGGAGFPAQPGALEEKDVVEDWAQTLALPCHSEAGKKEGPYAHISGGYLHEDHF